MMRVVRDFIHSWYLFPNHKQKKSLTTGVLSWEILINVVFNTNFVYYQSSATL